MRFDIKLFTNLRSTGFRAVLCYILLSGMSQLCIAGTVFFTVRTSAGNTYIAAADGTSVAEAEAHFRAEHSTFPEYQDGRYRLTPIALNDGTHVCNAGSAHSMVITRQNRAGGQGTIWSAPAVGVACAKDVSSATRRAFSECQKSPECLNHREPGRESWVVAGISGQEGGFQCSLNNRQVWWSAGDSLGEAFCKSLNK